MNTKIKNNYWFFLFFFIVFTAILFFAPHTVDDNYYDYLNLKDFGDILKFSAGYGNGRVLGNMLAVYLCKSRIAAVVVRALSITGVLYLIPKLIENEVRSITLLCTSLLLIGIGPLAFGEVYSWISAFSNYLPPVVCVLICVIEIRNGMDNSRPDLLKCIIIFILGYAGQLFTENSTVNNFVISFIIIVFFIVKKRNLKLPIIFFASTSLGSVTLLALRLFCHDERGLYSTADYGVKFGSVIRFFLDCLNNYIKFSKWTSQWIVLFVFLQIEIFMILKYSKTEKNIFSKAKFWILGCTLLHLLLLIINIFVSNIPLKAAILVTFTLYLLCLILLSGYMDKKIKFVYLFTLILSIFTATYLLVLNPLNPRILFYTYIILTCLVLVLLPYTIEKFSEKIMKMFSIVSKVILCAFSIAIFIIHIDIYKTNIKVNDFVDLQIKSGEDKVCVCPISETGYFHDSFTRARLGYTYYKNEPFDVEFIDVDTDEWKKIYEKWNIKN